MSASADQSAGLMPLRSDRIAAASHSITRYINIDKGAETTGINPVGDNGGEAGPWRGQETHQTPDDLHAAAESDYRWRVCRTVRFRPFTT